MDDIAAKIELRNRVMRRQFRAMSMEERVRHADQLQRDWATALSANPEAFDEWYRRNLTKRAITRPAYRDLEDLRNLP